MDPRPVGVFDSGLGGASVLREALTLLPHENYIYYGDNLNAPYGDKTEAEITALTFRCADELVSRGVKAILIACNTATATCIRQIREKLEVPVVSVEPAIKPACAADGTGKVLMMATLATTKLGRYLELQSRMPDPGRVINVPCPGLVDRIERNVLADDAFDDLFDRFLSPYHGMEIDGIVLGCTHYIFIRGAIARYAAAHFKGACRFYDGNAATVRQLARVLEEKGLSNDAGSARAEFCTSGDEAVYRPIFNSLLSR
ncbi:MAG: glutamate racemase [Clostridiaceae bacterium]|nr:glutamate racemase [Eubacteriales bacterium]